MRNRRDEKYVNLCIAFKLLMKLSSCHMISMHFNVQLLRNNAFPSKFVFTYQLFD